MNAFAILLPVIFPIIAGACLLPVKFSDRKARQRVVLPIIVLNAIFALYAIFFADSGAITIFRFSNRLSLALHVDGLSKIFGTMVSLLWIPTTIYAFEYMTHEGHEDRFFSFFTMTFGVVIGIAFADNFLTMYLFYEFLTLVTLPIVMHQFDNKARHAGKTYVLYMMFGASLAFIGFVFVLFYGTTTDFAAVGICAGVLRLWCKSGGIPVLSLAAEGIRCPHTRYGSAACRGSRKIRCVCHHPSDVLRLRYGISDWHMGAVCDADCSFDYDCVRLDRCTADTAYQKKICIFYHLQSVLYHFWRCHYDTDRACGRDATHDLSCGNQNYTVLYCRCDFI